MTLIKKDLDKIRREFMAKEIELDILENRFRSSSSLNHSGNFELPVLLLDAVMSGDEKTLASELKNRQCMRVYDAVTSNGGVSLKRVSDRRYAEFSEKTFNKFYLRGLCREAAQAGCKEIVLRDESVEQVFRIDALLSALRTDADIEDIIGISKSEKRAFKVEY